MAPMDLASRRLRFRQAASGHWDGALQSEALAPLVYAPTAAAEAQAEPSSASGRQLEPHPAADAAAALTVPDAAAADTGVGPAEQKQPGSKKSRLSSVTNFFTKRGLLALCRPA